MLQALKDFIKPNRYKIAISIALILFAPLPFHFLVAAGHVPPIAFLVLVFNGGDGIFELIPFIFHSFFAYIISVFIFFVLNLYSHDRKKYLWSSISVLAIFLLGISFFKIYKIDVIGFHGYERNILNLHLLQSNTAYDLLENQY
jgi:uncharacterized membrane protein